MSTVQPNPTDPQDLADRLAAAMLASSVDALVPLFDEDVTWGDCAGRDDVAAFVAQALGEGVQATAVDIEDLGDRMHAAVQLNEHGEIHVAIFHHDGLVTELHAVESADHARQVQPTGPIDIAAARPVSATTAAPILPVASVVDAVAHYRSLGFEVQHYEGHASYAFASIDAVELHLAQVDHLDPKTNTSALYLYVSDADALYARWRRARVAGRLIAPTDTDYGLREGAHIDPDGNLIRFGAPATPNDPIDTRESL